MARKHADFNKYIGPDHYRQCIDCGEWILAKDYYYYSHDYSLFCQTCGRIRFNARRAANSEKAVASTRRWRLNNAEHMRELRRNSYWNNLEASRARSKRYREEHKDELREKKSIWQKENRPACDARKKRWTDAHKGDLLERAKKLRKKPVPFATYESRLSYAEDAVDFCGYLAVPCAYCGGRYLPGRKDVEKRINSLEGRVGGENRFYCSQGCKDACPTFNKRSWPEGYAKDSSREVQPELRQLVLARDAYECQRCGAGPSEELHCHHYEGIEQNPIESADVDMCITLCKACHHAAHRELGCRFYDLRCS